MHNHCLLLSIQWQHQILRFVYVTNRAVALRSASIPHSLVWASRTFGQSVGTGLYAEGSLERCCLLSFHGDAFNKLVSLWNTSWSNHQTWLRFWGKLLNNLIWFKNLLAHVASRVIKILFITSSTFYIYRFHQLPVFLLMSLGNAAADCLPLTFSFDGNFELLETNIPRYGSLCWLIQKNIWYTNGASIWWHVDKYCSNSDKKILDGTFIYQSHPYSLVFWGGIDLSTEWVAKLV
jgi:hypothetical protein